MLANDWQRDFPLVPRPFAQIGAACGRSEADVLHEFSTLQALGVIDRVGPVFRPHTVGASTLAAMAVPAQRLEALAALVGRHAGVNHSYEREHRYNLWFVVTGASESQVQGTLACIEDAAGLPVLRLPLVEEYHIDLGFDLRTGAAPRRAARGARLGGSDKTLAARLAKGLPLVPRPYAQIGCAESEVLEKLARWLELGVVRRIGAVVRHRSLGITANAMVVWEVPDDEVAAAGAQLAADTAVTLCYRRAPARGWPYNLYCMLHGRSRGRVLADIERLSEPLPYPRAILFSRRCFVQRAPHYG